MICHFTDKKHLDDTDDDSGMGPSTHTDTTSATHSEVSHYLLIHVLLCDHSCIHLLSTALGFYGQRVEGSGL